MNQKDNVFFESYKHLDLLCGDIFNCRNGISEYILQMEETHSARYKITGWSEDYQMLKHVRWVRNQIAHSTSDSSFSTKADLEFVKSFYHRIMVQDDSFARLRKAKRKKGYQANHPTHKSSESSSRIKYSDDFNRSTSKGHNIVIGLIIIISIIMVIGVATAMLFYFCLINRF